jgi:hypothetical protein
MVCTMEELGKYHVKSSLHYKCWNHLGNGRGWTAATPPPTHTHGPPIWAIIVTNYAKTTLHWSSGSSWVGTNEYLCTLI